MIGFNALGASLLALLFIPLIIFYFLKLKRPKVEISSLFLWQQVINDSRVNSPFQKFKKHILLFLQLLILLFLVLAAMQPYYFSAQKKRMRIPIIIDNSASMGALDKKGGIGISRLEEAKRLVRDMINNKLPDQEYSIITFSNTARRQCGFTSNSRVLLDALEKIRVEDLPSDIEDALRMAQAMARSFSFDEVILFSDGNFPSKVTFDLPFKLNYQKLAPGGPNLGITSFTARRAGDNAWNIFVQLSGTENAPTATIELYKDGKLIESEEFSQGGRPDERIIFQVGSSSSMELKVKIVPDGFDSLKSDNEAFMNLPVMRPLRIYIPLEMTTFRRAMSGVKGIRIFPDDEGRGDDITACDLVITDRRKDLKKDCITFMIVDFVPEDLKKFIRIDKGGSKVIDWDHDCPLLQHVELSELLFMEKPMFLSNVKPADLENLGFEVIVHGSSGPLMLSRKWTDRLSYVLLFNVDHSTLPYRIAFPVMISNLIKTSMERAGLADKSANHTGVLPDMKLTPESIYIIKTPSGDEIEEKSTTEGMLTGVPALNTGEYSISEGTKDIGKMGVSLLSARETLLKGVDSIYFNELSVSAEKKTAKTARSLWQLLSIIALCVLIIEWWFFQKRPGGILN